MSPRTTAILGIVALMLGAFVYFNEIEGEEHRQAAEENEKLIHSGIAASDISAISMRTLDQVDVRFERRDGVWFVVSPVKGRADASAIDAMAHALANLPRMGDVETGESPDAVGLDSSGLDSSGLDSFGLGDDAATIRFELSGQGEPAEVPEVLGLRVGGSTPVGGHRYVTRLGAEEVAFVESYRVNAFNRNLDDLRDRRIFDFDDGEVATIRLRWPTSGGDSAGAAERSESERASGAGWTEVALARAESGEWFLGSPVVGPADEDTLRELISNLAFMGVERFVDAADENVQEALARTALEFHWTVAGEHLERHARIAGEVDGRRVFESEGGRTDLISAARLEDFSRTMDAYRFRELAGFDVTAARRLELTFSDRGSEATKEPLRVEAELLEGGWQGTDSDDAAIASALVSSLVRQVSNLKATSIFAEEMGSRELSSLGLDPPQATLVVRGSKASEPNDRLATLRIGRDYPGRGVFIQRADALTVFLIEPGLLGEIPISAERYRERFQVEVGSEEALPALPEMGAEGGGGFDVDPLEGLELP